MKLGFILLLHFVTELKPADAKETTYRKQDSSKLMLLIFSAKINAASLVTCSTKCSLSDKLCYGFTYNKVLKECYLGSYLVPTNITHSNPDTKIYSTGQFCDTHENVTLRADGGLNACDFLECFVMNITLGSDNNYNPDDPKVYRSCKDVVSSNPRQLVKLSTGIVVMCDTQTDGGGWTIFQRRVTGDVIFEQDWNNYKFGFGDYSNGDFYLGNEHLYCMTSSKNYEMMVDLKCTSTNFNYVYSSFKLSDESSGYKLFVTPDSGSAGDSLSAFHNNKAFYTYDRDLLLNFPPLCAAINRGGWWYYGPSCMSGYLNGPWDRLLVWPTLSFMFCLNPATSEMKIRPK